MQKPEELYRSRELRFRKDNSEEWLRLIGAGDGTDILEVGCGPGLFCHRLMDALPAARITGLDLDTANIEFARSKADSLKANGTFVNGDATALPFDDESFDLCYSHTVMNFCEPDAFIREQRRVLRPGGRISILCVVNRPSGPESWAPREGDLEKPLFDKLWAEAGKNRLSDIRRYENDEHRYFYYLQKHGFRKVGAAVLAVLCDAPDCAESHELGVLIINEKRLSELSSVEKARNLAPDALTMDEYKTLCALVNRRYDSRLALYEQGESLWEYEICTVLSIFGIK